MTETTASALIERYDAFLLDAYGVLVDGSGPLPYADTFVRALHSANKTKRLLSNDASRTPERIAARLQRFDIGLREPEILSSGMMIEPWVREHALEGHDAIILGPRGSHVLATQAGLRPVPPDTPQTSVVVVCDEAGYDFVPSLEATLTTLIARIAAGLPCHLALPNPDVLYPKPAGAVGLTAGAAAVVLERGLQARFGDAAPSFTRLGKPHAPIFDRALRSVAPAKRILMIGDQLETDVAGALAAGIDVALVETGVGRRPPANEPLQPTWVLESLAL